MLKRWLSYVKNSGKSGEVLRAARKTARGASAVKQRIILLYFLTEAVFLSVSCMSKAEDDEIFHRTLILAKVNFIA